MAMGRLLDYVFFVYFLTHIPITIFIDAQAMLPTAWFPKQAVDLVRWYVQEFRDPMMSSTPEWFRSFILCELTLQFPFFFVATYAFYKGGCRWIRVPAIVYSTHVITTLVPILYHIASHDFSESPHPGPRTSHERGVLAAVYLPYLVIPILILLRTLFSADYAPDTPAKLKER